VHTSGKDGTALPALTFSYSMPHSEAFKQGTQSIPGSALTVQSYYRSTSSLTNAETTLRPINVANFNSYVDVTLADLSGSGIPVFLETHHRDPEQWRWRVRPVVAAAEGGTVRSIDRCSPLISRFLVCATGGGSIPTRARVTKRTISQLFTLGRRIERPNDLRSYLAVGLYDLVPGKGRALIAPCRYYSRYGLYQQDNYSSPERLGEEWYSDPERWLILTSSGANTSAVFDTRHNFSVSHVLPYVTGSDFLPVEEELRLKKFANHFMQDQYDDDETTAKVKTSNRHRRGRSPRVHRRVRRWNEMASL